MFVHRRRPREFCQKALLFAGGGVAGHVVDPARGAQGRQPDQRVHTRHPGAVPAAARDEARLNAGAMQPHP